MIAAGRAVLALLLLLGGGKVFHQLVGLEIARMNPGPAGLEEAIRWDPERPDSHYTLGLFYRDSPEHFDPEASRGHLEEAARLNPYQWRYRLELGKTYELASMTGPAGEAYRKAVEINPKAAGYRWRLANFALRSGAPEEALEQFGRAVQLEPSGYLQPTLGLLWKAGFDSEDIQRIWPEDKPARLLLARFWTGQGEAGAEPAGLEWEKLVGGDSEIPTVVEGEFFIRYLMERRDYEQAREEWIRLTEANGLSDPLFSTKENWVWNGDFAITETLGRALDWNLRESDAYDVVVGGSENQEGLRIDFAGVENLNLSGLEQRAVVEPGSYEFSFRARAQGIGTEQGPYFELSAGRTVVRTLQLLGDSPWQEYPALIDVAPEDRIMRIRLRREPSRRIDNKLRGTLWLSGVRLRKIQ